MTSNMSWQSISKSRWLSTLVLMPLLAIWLIYTDGLASGGRQFLGLSFLLALMVFSLRAMISMLARLQIFDWLQWALLAFSVLYAVISHALGWPGMEFLAFVGVVGGAFIGLVVAFTLPKT